MTGLNVTVQVKNGKIYEGVLNTFSPEMEVVLKLVHIVDECTPPGSIPSKESLVDTIVFNYNDVVNIHAKDVDPNFAIKSAESFTDTAISAGKLNGQNIERELQPWEGEEAGAPLEMDGGLDSASAANGWDADAMFNVNAEKFNIQSSYDPDLSQYTTSIEKSDSADYKKREADAERLAKEIERSENYKKNLDLENGDADEEMLYSAVHRSEGSQNQKYVPPPMRNKQNRLGRSSNGPTASPAANAPSANPHTPTEDPSRIQKKSESELTKVAEPTSPLPPKESSKKPCQNASKPREEQIRELKDFSNQFKLSDPDAKEKKPVVSTAMSSVVSHVVSPSPAKIPSNESVVTTVASPTTTSVTAVSASTTAAAQASSTSEAQKSEEASSSTSSSPAEKKEVPLADKVVKSSLNPYAKEFNPTAKPFGPVPTPPRPATQSPVVPLQNPIQPGTIYPPFMVPVTIQGGAQTMINANGHQQARFPATNKKVTVSVQPQPRSDLNQAAQAATGTPILQSVLPHHQQPGHQYGMTHYVPQPMMAPGMQQVYSHQVVPGARLMPPQMMQASQQMSASDSNLAQAQQAQQQQLTPAGHVFVPPHVGQQQSQQQPQPGHIAPHHQQTPPMSQAQQLPPPSHSSSAGPPNASPAPGQQQQQPNSGGTPQPHHLMYAGQQQQQQAPPLQPSPHTPTSPQQYPPPVSLGGGYTYSCMSVAGVPGSMPGPIQHMAYGQAQPQVTHAQHQHSHMMMHQQAQQQQPGPANVQYHHQMPHPIQAPPQLGQAGPAVMHPHPIYMHPQIPTQGPPPNQMPATGASYGHNQ